MKGLNQVLLILHFFGLAMGLSVSIANTVMSILIAKAAPPEKAILGRFPPVMSRIGKVGLSTLWVTGLILVYTKWGGFANLTWPFFVKVAAVVALTVVVFFIHGLERRIQQGDMAAGAAIVKVGRVAASLAVTATIFAVLTFE